MICSMTVDVQCPLCDDGLLTATVDPESITDLEDDGCRHAEAIWADLASTWHGTMQDIWAAVEEEGMRRYDDAMERAVDRLRDGE